MTTALVTVRDDDPRLAALAELVHQLRPSWDRAGCRAAIHAARTGRRTLDQLVHVAIDAALDTSAQTPAAIGHTARWERPVEQPVAKVTPIPEPFVPSPPGIPPTSDYAEARAALRKDRA